MRGLMGAQDALGSIERQTPELEAVPTQFRISDQLGFKEMHPATYLNGERWEDEIINTPKPQQQTQADSIDLLTNRDWAKDLMEPGNAIESHEFYK